MNTNRNNIQRIILLIEDEESLRRSITFTLLRQGHCVVPYGTIDEAMTFLADGLNRNQRIILIITDLQLPGKNGIDLVRHARSLNQTIPILIITGHGSREMRDELARLGVRDILDKPFDIEELVTKVTKILIDAERM